MKGISEGVVQVAILPDEEVQALNRVHRGIDEPTDVLTFPAPETARPLLGDIAISAGFAEAGAKARKTTLSNEAAMLAIHGALHLAGMDDQTEEEHRLMVEDMNEAASRAGLVCDPGWSSMPH